MTCASVHDVPSLRIHNTPSKHGARGMAAEVESTLSFRPPLRCCTSFTARVSILPPDIDRGTQGSFVSLLYQPSGWTREVKMKLRTSKPWMPAPEYGRSLSGLTVNLLVRDIETALAFQRQVLGAEIVYSDPDFRDPAVSRRGMDAACGSHLSGPSAPRQSEW